MSREYDQLAWVDYPETLTPISAANLNRMENGIANLYTDRNKMENNIAYVEEGETATRHYFINSYLMLNGIFYKTTSEINIGDILDPTLAGNIEHVDVSSQFGSGGGGSTGCVELTQAQYDALSEEAKMLDVIYLITDSPDNYLDEVFGDFATVEYTGTASKAYAVGDYLVYDSKFYKVTSAIALGGTITPNTNVTQTTVGDEISNRAKWGYKSSVSINGIKDPGLYFCQSCTDVPLSVFNEWSVEVIASGKGESAGTIVQIAKPTIRSGLEFTRYFTNNAWTPWAQAGRTVAINDNLSTVKYYPKPGSARYGSFIVMGTYYGVGSTAVLCSVENGSLGSMINMFTGQTYSGGLAISFGVENGVGWIGLKTSSSGISVGCIIG